MLVHPHFLLGKGARIHSTSPPSTRLPSRRQRRPKATQYPPAAPDPANQSPPSPTPSPATAPVAPGEMAPTNAASTPRSPDASPRSPDLDAKSLRKTVERRRRRWHAGDRTRRARNPKVMAVAKGGDWGTDRRQRGVRAQTGMGARDDEGRNGNRAWDLLFSFFPFCQSGQSTVTVSCCSQGYTEGTCPIPQGHPSVQQQQHERTTSPTQPIEAVGHPLVESKPRRLPFSPPFILPSRRTASLAFSSYLRTPSPAARIMKGHRPMHSEWFLRDKASGRFNQQMVLCVLDVLDPNVERDGRRRGDPGDLVELADSSKQTR